MLSESDIVDMTKNKLIDLLIVEGYLRSHDLIDKLCLNKRTMNAHAEPADDGFMNVYASIIDACLD